MEKIVLGLDFDGVLYDWHSAVHTYFQYEMGYEGSYHDFWSTYMNSLSKERQDYLVRLPLLCDATIPSQRVMDFLEFASQHSDIYYITSRPVEVEAITRKYMKKYDFPFQDNLFVTNDKATVCRYVGVTHFLDDQAKNLVNIAPIADAYLFAKLWNKEYREEYKVVYSLKEFQEAVFNDI